MSADHPSERSSNAIKHPFKKQRQLLRIGNCFLSSKKRRFGELFFEKFGLIIILGNDPKDFKNFEKAEWVKLVNCNLNLVRKPSWVLV